MGDGKGNSIGLPPFLLKTYEMVDDQSTDSVVSWSLTNKSFIVWDTALFARDLLPSFFKHNNFSSFIRQLNTYGFRKIDPDQWEFANDEFIRNQPHLLKNIHRRKAVHSHSIQNLQVQGNSNPLTESERWGYGDRVERLRHEKYTLNMELGRLNEEQEETESQAQLLSDHMQLMELRQNQMYSFLAEKLQKPGLVVNLMPQMESRICRKRRFSRCEYEEDSLAGSCRGSPDSTVASSVLGIDLELLDRLESSLCFWEHILTDMEDVVIYEMNSEPCDPTCIPSSGAQGANDVFWEQFLTENPVSYEESELKTNQDTENKSTEYGKYWWSVRSGNTPLEHIARLTAGRS